MFSTATHPTPEFGQSVRFAQELFMQGISDQPDEVGERFRAWHDRSFVGAVGNPCVAEQSAKVVSMLRELVEQLDKVR